jgi:hypothetical protein
MQKQVKKKQSNMSSTKLNSFTPIDTSYSEVDEVSDKELKIMIIRTINKIKENMYKCLNEFQKNTNKQLEELRKTMQDMKEEFNKDIQIL